MEIYQKPKQNFSQIKFKAVPSQPNFNPIPIFGHLPGSTPQIKFLSQSIPIQSQPVKQIFH